MVSVLVKRSTKKVKALASTELDRLIKELRATIPETTTMLQCAEKEKRRRLQVQREREELQHWKRITLDGDQSS